MPDPPQPKPPDTADLMARGELGDDPRDGCEVVEMNPRRPLRQPGDDGDIIDEYEEPAETDWLRRDLVDAAQRGDAAEAERLAAELRRRTAVVEPIPTIGPAEIFAPLDPLEWVVEGLEIAHGAPTMIAGYGYSGKTVAVQSLELALAAGLPIWGEIEVERARVVHVDYEQGERLTRERFQRLGRAMGVDVESLIEGDWLRLASFPRVHLIEASEQSWRKLCEGRRFLGIDSLRAAVPEAEENSSIIRRHLDMLTRCSGQTECACVLLHHARKAQQNAAAVSIREVIRGSGALFDALQSCLVFVGEKGEPPVVHHEKARVTGQLRDTFALEIFDVASPDGKDLRWGLGVKMRDLEALQVSRAEDKRDKMVRLVLAFIRDNPDCSDAEIRSGVTGNNGDKRAALDLLERTGKAKNLTQSKRGVRAKWRAI